MGRNSLRSVGVGLIAAVTILALGACETATPYQPQAKGGAISGGYSEQKVGSDRYRVSFQGNAVTERETVEQYLLYRSAELTVQAGYDWFELLDRDTERKTEQVGPDAYFGWTPTWYYLGRGRWTVIDDFGPDFFDSYAPETVTRFQATAEIFLGHGAKPENDPKAFDAHEVVTNLGPAIKRPAAKP